MDEESMLPMIRELLGDIAEKVSDAVPLIKIAGEVTRIAVSLPDRILYLKIDRFLKAVPVKVQHEFVHRLQDDPALRRKVGEHLILTLDKTDDMEKADLLAKMFCAYAEKKIPLETFKRLTSSINAAFIEDLRQIAEAMPSVFEPFLGSLVGTGFAEITAQQFSDSWQDHRVVTAPRLNLLGRIFRQIMRGEPVTGDLNP